MKETRSQDWHWLGTHGVKLRKLGKYMERKRRKEEKTIVPLSKTVDKSISFLFTKSVDWYFCLFLYNKRYNDICSHCQVANFFRFIATKTSIVCTWFFPSLDTWCSAFHVFPLRLQKCVQSFLFFFYIFHDCTPYGVNVLLHLSSLPKYVDVFLFGVFGFLYNFSIMDNFHK